MIWFTSSGVNALAFLGMSGKTGKTGKIVADFNRKLRRIVVGFLLSCICSDVNGHAANATTSEIQKHKKILAFKIVILFYDYDLCLYHSDKRFCLGVSWCVLLFLEHFHFFNIIRPSNCRLMFFHFDLIILFIAPDLPFPVDLALDVSKWNIFIVFSIILLHLIMQGEIFIAFDFVCLLWYHLDDMRYVLVIYHFFSICRYYITIV